MLLNRSSIRSRSPKRKPGGQRPIFSEAIAVDSFLPVMSPVSRLTGEDETFIPLNVMYQRVLSEHQVLMLKMGIS